MSLECTLDVTKHLGAGLGVVLGSSHHLRPTLDVDGEIRAFLKRPDWFDHREDLEVLLVKNPHWSPAPFLDALPKGSKAWWQFWGGNEPDPAHSAYLLELLMSKPEATVKDRCKALLQHADATVAHAAKQVLDAANR